MGFKGSWFFFFKPEVFGGGLSFQEGSSNVSRFCRVSCRVPVPGAGTGPPAAPSPDGREIPPVFRRGDAGEAAYLFKPSFEVSFVSK